MNAMSTSRQAKVTKWIKKVGVWGFLFFLVKGLVWVAIGYWAVK